MAKISYADFHSDITQFCITGIEQCKWPGRQQVVYRDHVTYYLDGAHTNKSAEACSDWFKSVANEEANKLQWVQTNDHVCVYTVKAIAYL